MLLIQLRNIYIISCTNIQTTAYYFCCTANCYSGEMSDIPITLVKARLNTRYCKQEKYVTCMPRIQVRSNSLRHIFPLSPKGLQVIQQMELNNSTIFQSLRNRP